MTIQLMQTEFVNRFETIISICNKTIIIKEYKRDKGKKILHANFNVGTPITRGMKKSYSIHSIYS